MLPEIKNMTTDEKIALVEELWEEIEQERATNLSEVQLQILDSRWKNHLENPTSGISLERFMEKYS
jgi:putative addiction module component (TIGR02574 family)